MSSSLSRSGVTSAEDVQSIRLHFLFSDGSREKRRNHFTCFWLAGLSGCPGLRETRTTRQEVTGY